ncbi:hypothetical protein PVAP13_1NG193500 [Panicum virgatum]|uniref:Uncharacterized protein n=1 Tax=Panicum virgatum TaxID=38727 RepID=A0A8T0WXU1_PANVG|nr:hypothetical protein PVAP13_1NG193500 [Panicum virgatum]
MKVWFVAVTLRNLYPPVYIMYRTVSEDLKINKNEMQKIVGENGPKESSENKNTKHHPLLLQISSFLLLQTYSSTNSYKKYILTALGYEESSTDVIF